jgi:hypothetical protein
VEAIVAVLLVIEVAGAIVSISLSLLESAAFRS